MKILSFFFLVLLFFSGLVPAHGDFGNWFVANKRLATRLDSSDKKMSFRFTCRENMTVTALALYCVETQDSPAYLVSLQEDVKGFPSGVPLTSASCVPLAQSWSTLPVDRVSLLKGKIYHVVVEDDIKRGGDHPVGVISPSNYASFLSTDLLNHRSPGDGSPDPAANTLYSENGKWKVLDQEPVYAVYGIGSHFQGNPYDDPGQRPIYGKVLQGQVLHFHCATTGEALTFRVRKQGNPTTPLKYVILVNDYSIHKCTPFYSADALQPQEAPSKFQWVTVGLPPQVQKQFRAECWYFAFQTDSGRPSSSPPGCEDCYVLSDVGNSGGLGRAADLTFDGGPHLSRATCSLDGGDPFHWLDDFERDANVGILGPSCPPSKPQEFAPIPTPDFLQNAPRFEP